MALPFLKYCVDEAQRRHRLRILELEEKRAELEFERAKVDLRNAKKKCKDHLLLVTMLGPDLCRICLFYSDQRCQ